MRLRFVILLLLAIVCQPGIGGEASRGMVVSVNAAATDAGIAVLRSGGNATDAAVAVGLTLGVVDPSNSGLGGGCFILLRTAKGQLIAIDGRERAPLAATRDMFVRDGMAQPQLSQTGPLAIGIPGSLAAYEHVLRKFGRKSLRELILPAADMAERGYVVSAGYAQLFALASNELGNFEASRAIFFKDNAPLKEGEVLRQPDLAKAYRAIAEQGTRWFYRGEFARVTADWMRRNGGLITVRDFKEYSIQLREPIVSKYRGGFEIVGFPPPSSGGVNVAQTLNILARFDVAHLTAADRHHLLAEAMKLSFADRAYWLGDPEFARVPCGLLDTSYAAEQASRIRFDSTTLVASHGIPPDWDNEVFKKHTTHFSVADSHGNWVACTTTLNTSFGSKVVIPGTGILMNNQMDDFSIQPGVTNFFGLVGSEANAVAAGKRPLSSMSPTLVLKHGRPVAALGASGGPTIISQVIQQLVAMLDLGLSPGAALQQPRIHHQWFPDQLVIEGTLPSEVKSALQARGHVLKEVSSIGACQVVTVSENDQFSGSADPRVANGKAGGL